jgi:phosphoribosyl 1,2-cyclic phosphodiesterase
MSLQIASLNSGSNANCYYIGNKNEAVLIDAGLSCRETEKRMNRLGLEMKSIKAVFISHEHADHISGLQVLAKKHRLPVYITKKTLQNSPLEIDDSLIYSFTADEPVPVGDLNVLPFTKNHDADDPHSFIISFNNLNIGVITDLGFTCRQTIKHFKTCDAVFLESNYCDQMLENGSYPLHLKRRISGKKGHLSNDQALELFLKHKSEHLQLLILSHLSQNNNHPEVVKKLFEPHTGKIKLVIASRHRESELFTIEKNLFVKSAKNMKKLKQNKAQLSLFEF